MKISDEDQKNHPQLTQYLRYAMPHVANVGVIAKAMHEHGLLSLDEFKKSVTWGEAPLVIIADSSKLPCGSVNSWYGCSRNDTEIEIDLTTLQAFEKGGDRTDKNAKGQNCLCPWREDPPRTRALGAQGERGAGDKGARGRSVRNCGIREEPPRGVR